MSYGDVSYGDASYRDASYEDANDAPRVKSRLHGLGDPTQDIDIILEADASQIPPSQRNPSFPEIAMGWRTNLEMASKPAPAKEIQDLQNYLSVSNRWQFGAKRESTRNAALGNEQIEKGPLPMYQWRPQIKKKEESYTTPSKGPRKKSNNTKILNLGPEDTETATDIDAGIWERLVPEVVAEVVPEVVPKVVPESGLKSKDKVAQSTPRTRKQPTNEMGTPQPKTILESVPSQKVSSITLGISEYVHSKQPSVPSPIGTSLLKTGESKNQNKISKIARHTISEPVLKAMETPAKKEIESSFAIPNTPDPNLDINSVFGSVPQDTSISPASIGDGTEGCFECTYSDMPSVIDETF